MTAGWLRETPGDDRITVLVDGAATYLRRLELADLLAGSVREAVLYDHAWRRAGTATVAVDLSRVWLDMSRGLLFAWTLDLGQLLVREVAHVPLERVHGISTTAPALVPVW